MLSTNEILDFPEEDALRIKTWLLKLLILAVLLGVFAVVISGFINEDRIYEVMLIELFVLPFAFFLLGALLGKEPFFKIERYYERIFFIALALHILSNILFLMESIVEYWPF